MKKKLLFINKSFELGGIQMALANLLEAICDEYDVTLAVFNPHGPFLARVPENVRLLKLSSMVEVLGMTGADCKAYGTWYQRLFKIVSSAWSKLFGNKIPVAFALAFQKNVGQYDVVISYHQETSAKTMVTGFGKFALEKCDAKRYVAWIHADFLATKLATADNLETYKHFDEIVAVSKTAMDSFVAAYPVLKDKCSYCYNALPVAEIMEKSNREKDVFPRNANDVILFSACRLVHEKGLVPALKALLSVFAKHPNLKWFIAGSGPEAGALQQVIEENGLQKQVSLLGFIENPYPYFKDADYLFLPSLHETFGMVVGEAQAVGTRVIASDIPIMREVLGENDFLCENNDYAVVLENLIQQDVSAAQPVPLKVFSDWKEQFERIVEC